MARALRLTEQQLANLQRLQQSLPKISKYRNKPTEYNGRKYGSRLEAGYAAQLDNEWHAGSVLWYTIQVPFVLEGGVIYRADFVVVRPTGFLYDAVAPAVLIQVVDSTGVMTPVKFNKLKQMEARYGIVVLIHQRDGSLIPYRQCPVARRKRNPSPGSP